MILILSANKHHKGLFDDLHKATDITLRLEPVI